MKNIDAGMGAVPMRKKKEVEVEKVEEEGGEGEVEEEYHQMENEMIFCLEEAPEFQISAVARWGENAQGEIVDQPDIYFRHISSGRLCQSVYACLVGVEHDQYAEEKWDTLYYRIRIMLLRDLRRIVCFEKKYEIHPI